MSLAFSLTLYLSSPCRWGTQKTRIGTDSQQPFGYCCLTLKPVVDPVVRYETKADLKRMLGGTLVGSVEIVIVPADSGWCVCGLHQPSLPPSSLHSLPAHQATSTRGRPLWNIFWPRRRSSSDRSWSTRWSLFELVCFPSPAFPLALLCQSCSCSPHPLAPPFSPYSRTHTRNTAATRAQQA